MTLCYNKKFMTNYGYPLYIFKKAVNVWTVTVLAISVHVLNVWKSHVFKITWIEKYNRKCENAVAKEMYK